MEFSRCTQAGGPPYEKYRAEARSLKTQQRAESTYIEVDVISRRTESPDGDLEKRSTSTSSAPTGIIVPVSLERR